MVSVSETNSGFVTLPSQHAVAKTLDRLEGLLKARGILVFARIDFGADATRAGLTMPPEQLLLFGNPKAGTPLMLAGPAVGLDLPLKALAWQDRQGKTWLAYNEPRYVVDRHGLDAALTANLAAVIPLIERAAATDEIPAAS